MKLQVKILLLVFFIQALSVLPVQAATITTRLSGRILLQVESNGEAWYVNPKDQKRYYLGRPDDAYNVMRRLSLGISEKEFASWSKGAPAWAKGGLYLRPESHGEAYYVDFSQRWHYLGRPLDAWQLLRSQGLGITNSDLSQIGVATLSSTNNTNAGTVTVVTPNINNYTRNLSWRYGSEDFSLTLNLQSSLYSSYVNSQKTFYYTGNLSDSAAREQFYNLFFVKKSGDTLVKDLISYAKGVASQRSWSQDQTTEFLLALIQYIPYDHDKLNESPMKPNYPYETVYKNSGICSDKTFLAVAVLRELGYGAAILDFPEANHSAAGIACPLEDSVNNSGYCYIETTDYFPIGVIPPSLSGGVAVVDGNNLDNLFSTNGVGKMEVFQKTSGLIYQGVEKTKNTVAVLQNLEKSITVQKPILEQKESGLNTQKASLLAQQEQLAIYKSTGNIAAYNNLVAVYNEGVNQYNADLAVYQAEANIFNQLVANYNQGVANLYQK